MKRAAESRNLFGYPRVQRRGASGWSSKTTAAESRAERKQERQQAKGEALRKKREAKASEEEATEAKQTQIEIQEEYAYNTGARHRKEGKKAHPASAILVTPKKYLGVVKASALARRSYMEGYRGVSNPCANTRKSNVSDRAKRYRANQKGCRPAGLKKCKLCNSRSDVMVDHIDGNESNGKKSNLRWLCRSCNNTLGAEMAKAKQGRRTVQYNPKEHKGAQTLGEYTLAVLEHTRHAHDRAGKIIHDTPKSKRREFAAEIWERRQKGTAASAGYGDAPDWVTNPEAIGQGVPKIIEVGGGRKKKVWKWEGHGWPKEDLPGFVSLDSVHYGDRKTGKVFMRGNPQDGPDGTSRSNSTEYRLGYNLGQTDRQSAQLSKTQDELYSVFVANFGGQHPDRIETFGNAYSLGYGPVKTIGNPSEAFAGRTPEKDGYRTGTTIGERDRRENRTSLEGERERLIGILKEYWHVPQRQLAEYSQGLNRGYRDGYNSRKARQSNPEPSGSDSEYEQAKRIAELFHGRPVKEEIEVTDEIRSHDWYAYIGPLAVLKIRALPGMPFRTAKLPFNVKKEEDTVQFFISPDGKQFYFRGGDQELDLDAFGMGEGTDWYRDHIVLGFVTYFAYLDRKKFHGFKLTEYTHKVGSALDSSGTKHIQRTNIRPILVYDTMSKKLQTVGGLGKVETETLVDGMSPGIVN